MSVERKSLWARKRSEWHKDAARTRLREMSDGIPLVLLLLAGVLGFLGVRRLGDPLGWAWLSGALLCLLTAWGLRTGREWARWLGGSFAVLLVVGGLASQIVQLVNGEAQGAVGWVVFWAEELLLSGVAIALLSRRGRKIFKDGREKLAAK